MVNLVIWSSGHLVIWLFGYLVIVESFSMVQLRYGSCFSRGGAAIRTCGAQRLRKDGAQLAGFCPKHRHIGTVDGVCPHDEVEPEKGFFRFLHNDTELGDEIRPGTSCAGGAIVGRD